MPEEELYPPFVGDSVKILRQVWDYIGHDYLVAVEENTGKDYVTGEELRWSVPDFIDPHQNPEWYAKWKLLSASQKEHILYIAFPKHQAYSF